MRRETPAAFIWKREHPYPAVDGMHSRQLVRAAAAVDDQYYSLASLYRQIIMVTSSDPDTCAIIIWINRSTT